LSADVQAVIRVMHPGSKRRIRAALDRIRAEPESGKPLMGELAGWWSVRVGRMRIIYRSRRASVEIAALGPRASVYLDAARMLPPKSRRR